MRKIVSSVRHEARQGQSRLTDRATAYVSPKSQNEILNIMANIIIREIASEIRSPALVQFSVIVDGTQDISGIEQESVCLR